MRLSRTLTNKEIKSHTGLSSRQIQRILKADDLGDYAKGKVTKHDIEG